MIFAAERFGSSCSVRISRMLVAVVGWVGRRHAGAEFVFVITVYTSPGGSHLGAVTEQPKQCVGVKSRIGRRKVPARSKRLARSIFNTPMAEIWTEKGNTVRMQA